ncbi:MAG TPA: PIG-L family deacetylase [Candidatus Saccharimonadales bacterium]|nr:PIG-L family deacetylase [Candidatus Saccharimonadales bacterium]
MDVKKKKVKVPKPKPKATKAVSKASKTGPKISRAVSKSAPKSKKPNYIKSLDKLVIKPWFRNVYVVGSVVLLLGTVIYWAILGAHLQQNNADQLSSAYLFKNAATLHGASFPAQHTFLLKWPLFYLIKMLNYSAGAFIGVTVGLVMATVLVLLAILYRIDRRPLVFGTICLALASVLLLIPAQPYSGGILPVNMAMLTTRNIEYAVYIVSLLLFARAKRIRSGQFWISTVILSVLIASDKLFLAVALAAAVMSLIVYSLVKSWGLVSLTVDWLISIVIAALGAAGILSFINYSGLTHIVGQSGVGPYGLIHNLRDFALGIIYGFLGLFTNLGANPAFAGTEIKTLPHSALSQLTSIGGYSYLVNLVIVVVGIYIVIKLTLSSLKLKTKPDTYLNLAIMLVWTTLASVALFVLSNHYYAVDARYLSIVTFTLFIAVAVVVRKAKLQPSKVVAIGGLVLISVLLGIFAVAKNINSQNQAFSTIKQRDASIIAAEKYNPTDVLVGDYWRVLPILQASKGKLAIMPLSGCTTPRSVLSSSVWQTDLKNHSFTYLLSSDEDLTDFPHCTLGQVVATYGRPNASILIAGTFSAPKEQLLYYSNGINNSAPTTHAPSTVVPETLDQLPNTSCPVPTTMTFVAHEDDDLLFMNPDIVNDINAGDCIRTVYLTAGDAGAGQFYYLSRERGVEAAYAAMAGLTKPVWVDKIVQIASEYIEVASPRANTKISLIFMHLPDGNLKGQGFAHDGFQSLAKLYDGQIKTIYSVDGQSSYSASQLETALSTLMSTYSPTQIYTQSAFAGSKFPDHSDHINVSNFVKQAYKLYETKQYANLVTIPISFYEGYTGRQQPANVSGAALATKEMIFLDYAKYDAGVCQTLQICAQTPTYSGYLSRQIQNSY